MKIYTKAGVIPYTQKLFGDGQRHIKLEYDDSGYQHATIEAAIRSADELLDVLLAKDALDATGKSVALDIRYLMGARMDRRDSTLEPGTLSVIARQLLAAGFRKIRILDPHSAVAVQVLGAEAVYPLQIAATVLKHYYEPPVVVAPDRGALHRVSLLGGKSMVVTCEKVRNNNAGGIVQYAINNPSLVNGKACLIMDDICDGGRTFTRCAAELRHNGAKSVDLFVTHGIFTYQDGQPFKLDGIDHIWSTDSFQNRRDGTITFPINMQYLA